MVKKSVSACCVAIAAVCAVPARAADLPARKAPPPVAAAAPLFTWTGFHLGFNRGYGGAVYEGAAAFAVPPAGWSLRSVDRASGWIAGLQAGYDHQFANGAVLGVETDIQWSDIQASHQGAVTAADPSLAAISYSTQRLNWFGTTRARLGYGFGRLLPYATAGVAYGQTSVGVAQALPGLVIGVDQRQTGVGWAAGAGVDIALSDRLSARAEYLYLQLPGVSGAAVAITPAFPLLAGSYAGGSVEAHLVRGGMNYRFAGLNDLMPAGPQGDLLDLLKGILFEPAAHDWSGVYAGVNAGYGGNVLNGVAADSLPGVARVSNVTDRSGGVIGGGQIGYQRQFANRLVVGVESDIHGSGVAASRQETVFGPNGAAVGGTSIAMDWFGTTRARLGLARGSTLAFVTGGAAYGGVSVSGAPFASTGATRFGWTVGSGTEYALSEKLSLRADYLYVSLNGVSGQAAGPAPASFSTGRVASHVTRVGLNWRFGLLD